MPVIKGVRYEFNQVPESVLEPLSLEQLRDVAEQEAQELAQADFAKQQEIEAAAEKANAEEFRRFNAREPEPVAMEKYENMTALEIQQMEAKDRAAATEAAKPEAQLEAAARAEEESLQKRIENLRYVAGEMEKGVEPVKQMARQAAAEQLNEINESLAIQRQWVASRPDFITSPENGEAMKNWIVNQGYTRFSLENLELAYTVLKQQGKLQLVPAEELQRRQQIQQQVDRPKAKFSSVPTKYEAGRGLYSAKPKEISEDDLYSMDLEQLRLAAGGDPNDPEVRQMTRWDSNRRGLGSI